MSDSPYYTHIDLLSFSQRQMQAIDHKARELGVASFSVGIVSPVVKSYSFSNEQKRDDFYAFVIGQPLTETRE